MQITEGTSHSPSARVRRSRKNRALETAARSSKASGASVSVPTPPESGVVLSSAACKAMIERAETARAHAESALRRSEEQLCQAQKMEAIGRLAGGVAHDFNNMLSVILGYGELLLGEVGQHDPMRSDLEEIRRAASRAADLTRQLLLFSRQQVTTPKVLDLREVLMSLEKMLKRILGEDIELTIVAPKDIGRVKVDPCHMEQVIMNLVVNARDAMPKGGKLTIELSNVFLDQTHANTHLNAKVGPYVALTVTDSGMGMTRETQARIFEPFFTTKEVGKGTGLGLSTVFGVVQQSGGNVWVYSELGLGTTFKVYLPQIDGETTQVQSKMQIDVVHGTETVLLVEDEEQVRTVMHAILKRQGYTVLAARSAAEALLLSEQHPHAIDLLLTDVVMPHMSGPDLMQRLAVQRPDMKVICMSGFTDDTIVRHGVLSESIPYLQKPVTPSSLASKLREVLDAGTLDAQLASHPGG